MWGLPMFDQTDVNAVMQEIAKCRAAFPNEYVRMNGYDSRKGRQTTMLSLMVNRPQPETEFGLERTEGQDRRVQYTIRTKPRVVVQR
jgi:ribulose-bisphosphate carboxylase small chain